MTVNILGRDITGTITSFREVDFSTRRDGLRDDAEFRPRLSARRIPFIATVYAPPEAEAAILRDVTKTWPNITAIRIREAVDRVTEALVSHRHRHRMGGGGHADDRLHGADRRGSSRGNGPRIYESAILKTLGATRARILASFALRSALMGAAAGTLWPCHCGRQSLAGR
jgi:putative ABC transport system permease protein